VAASAEGSTSDIDLMVIGSPPLSKISPLLRELERRLGRAINPTVYTVAEFTERVENENHFVTTVLRETPLFIVGGSNELAKLTAVAKDQRTQNKPPRSRRSTRRR